MSEDTWSGSDDTSASDFYPAIDSDDEDNETSYYGMGANEGAEHADAFAAGLRRLLEPSRVTSPPLLRAIVETEVRHMPDFRLHDGPQKRRRADTAGQSKRSRRALRAREGGETGKAASCSPCTRENRQSRPSCWMAVRWSGRFRTR
jgi:hypothetical protein